MSGRDGRVVLLERWVTYETEFTCRRCRELHGAVFRVGEGPQPPLHQGCRCVRVYVGREEVRDEA